MNDIKPSVWFPFYLKDFLVDTATLTSAQRWDYVMLLGHQWYQGHFREEDIAKIVGLNSDILESSSASSQLEFSQAVSRRLEPVIRLLSVDAAGLYFSPRLDVELAKAIENRRSHAERGRKGGMEKEKRRREKLASSASSSALAEGVATGLAKSYPAPAPVQEQKPYTPLSPSAQPASGGLTPRPTPLGDSTEPEVPEISETKAKRQGNALGATGMASGIGRASSTVGKGVQQIASANNGTRTQAHDATKGDRRFDAFKAEISEFWREQNPSSAICPWIRPDARALSEYLAGNPAADLAHFKKLLINRAQSGVNPAAPPRKWLRDLEEFAAGPLDRYLKPARGSRQL